MNKIKLSQYIVQALKTEQASYVFMVPGGYVDNFSNSLVAVDGIHPVVCTTEGGAAMMADGFARASGEIGVCLGITGPGASNMLTALSVSAADRIPVLAITGDTPLSWRDRDAIQDPGTHGLKSIELLRLISSAQYQVFEADLVGDYIRRSMTMLKSADAGVAHLSVPMDIQTALIDPDYQSISSAALQSRPCDQVALEAAFSRMSESHQTVLLIGAGVRKSGAFEALRKFAEQYDIPVATTMSAKGDFPENHPLAMGVFGWAGTGLANETLLTDEIECLIVVGSKLGQISTLCWNQDLRSNRQLIHIDINASNLNHAYVADIAAVSDARAAFDYFCQAEGGAKQRMEESRSIRRDWLRSLRSQRPWFYKEDTTRSELLPIHPSRVVAELSAVFPERTQLFVDNGAHTFFTTHYWPANQPNHCFNIIKYSGAMGWAIAASIGAKFARPDVPTIAVVGDGCMLMHGMEIQTAARYKLKKMVFVVLNNKAHGNPKLRTDGFTKEAEALTDIVDHSWAEFAESLGVKGLTVNAPEDLHPVFEQALHANQTVLIDVKCGSYATPTKVFDETFMKEFNAYLSN